MKVWSQSGCPAGYLAGLFRFEYPTEPGRYGLVVGLNYSFSLRDFYDFLFELTISLDLYKYIVGEIKVHFDLLM